MTWGWAPVGGPTAADTRHGEDWESWWWEIRVRGHSPRRIEIRLSRALVAAVDDPDLARDLREAVLTRGRSEIARIALWEIPPNRVELDTTRRHRVGGRVARPA